MNNQYVNSSTKGGATLSTTASNIIDKNESTLCLVITNLDSSINVYLAFGETAVAEQGVALLAGTTLSFDIPYGLTVSAIAASGTPKVSWNLFTQHA